MSKQLTLFDLSAITPPTTQVYDPAWDDDTVDSQIASQGIDNSSSTPESQSPLAQESFSHNRWNPADFGEVPHKADGDHLTIFYDDTNEPPDPDDYQNLTDYEQAWREWRLRVGAQVESDTQLDTVELLVGAQVNRDTKKVAPQHDKQTHWVEKYWVQREGNKYWYYRYCWMTGRKKHRRYIGSVESAIAKNRKLEVESAIADGESPAEIENLIRSWRKS
ncbi:MAG: hypothetical protein RMX68_005835 [Aulosira sp. ZfuVER01]|nr:hypothetical protein [Aulosira sp. ZfuVER01]MDZ8000495.1 hypothetical protein [Aulosira sp. DedVER01a]MDZ8052967.1 hypothetical protein [Aulosira sp. ZfuCHP01]